jgi:hypothetical protein
MKLVPRKTRKAIRKSVRKIIKQHGPELAAAMAGGALGEKVSELLATDDRQKSPKQSGSSVKTGKKKAKRGKKLARRTDEPEPAE